MKKVLIITYYWPPSGGGGVQRWLKFAKYLPGNGWQPIVAVPDDPEYPVVDNTLVSEIPEEAIVIKLPIWEPYCIFKKITGRKKEEKVNTGLLFDGKKQTLTEKVSLWIRGNLLIPDPRLFWVKSSTRKLRKLIPELQIDAIITTGPPHSVHLIGYKLKKVFGIPWIADLRDPWSEFDILDKFYPTKFARKKQKRIEKKTLSFANKVITVSPTWANDFQKIVNAPVESITNGFDTADLTEISESKGSDGGFLISHVGMINSYRNHTVFWEALNELCDSFSLFGEKLKIQIVGIYDKGLNEELAQYSNLQGKLSFSSYIPHDKVWLKYAESDCLLLLQNKSQTANGHIPGKVFEYLASKKPILALASPTSDIANLIEDCNAGFVCNFDDKDSIKSAVMSIFNKENPKPDAVKIDAFSRENLTKKLVETIGKTIGESRNAGVKETGLQKKRVLIISYYWPPSGGGGVMRWLKMSKFLPELGWQPIVYTPQNPDPSISDTSLLKEVHKEIIEVKTPIWEPYDIYRRLTNKKGNAKFKAGYISEASSGNWKSRLSVFIRGNFLIPDPRKFWIRPSVRYLSKYLKNNPVDLIVSTGPPHSMHLIALGLKKRFDIPWIADFRDPWTDIDFYSKLKLTKWADKKHRKLELEVLTRANHVVTVSPGCALDLSNVASKKVEVINNGYDPLDYNFGKTELDSKFTISHFGAFNSDRNPLYLWRVLGELSMNNKEFKNYLRIQLIGQTAKSVINEIEKNHLYANCELIEHLPHKEGLNKLSKSQILLLPLNNAPNVQGILPGKMYEYMALQRPILAIGPTSADFAKILKETNTGIAHNFDDIKGLKQTVENYFKLFQENKLEVNSSSFEKYSRKNLAGEFVKLIEK